MSVCQFGGFIGKVQVFILFFMVCCEGGCWVLRGVLVGGFIGFRRVISSVLVGGGLGSIEFIFCCCFCGGCFVQFRLEQWVIVFLGIFRFIQVYLFLCILRIVYVEVVSAYLFFRMQVFQRFRVSEKEVLWGQLVWEGQFEFGLLGVSVSGRNFYLFLGLYQIRFFSFLFG